MSRTNCCCIHFVELLFRCWLFQDWTRQLRFKSLMNMTRVAFTWRLFNLNVFKAQWIKFCVLNQKKKKEKKLVDKSNPIGIEIWIKFIQCQWIECKIAIAVQTVSIRRSFCPIELNVKCCAKPNCGRACWLKPLAFVLFLEISIQSSWGNFG